MTLYRALFALFLAVTGLLIPAIPASHAQAATCTTVWLTGPSYNDRFEAGDKRCIWPKARTANGWVKLYQFNDRTKPIVDYIQPWNYTKTRPNNGLYKPNADRLRKIADIHNVNLQFAYKAANNVGCTGTWATQVSGVYHSNPNNPGKGLIRIGTGTKRDCMMDRAGVLNIGKHEVSHAIMERKCPNYLTKARAENVTDAFAWKFLNASSKSAGNYGFNSRDLARAIDIKYKRC
jgi:hypothetical protein